MVEKTEHVNVEDILTIGRFEDSTVNVKRRTPEKVIAEEVLNAQGAIVAVADTQGVSMYLVNRYNMLEQAWRRF